MVDSKFFKGESKTVEFKAKLPDKSETYMKTIIAFANTSGGKLIIGIDDNKSIIGIDKDNIFEIMDKVTNAISDACEPKKPIKEPIKELIKADKNLIITSKQRKKFDRENLIIKYVEEHGSISNMEARQILVLAESTTKRFLKEMVKEGLLLEEGERKNRRYILANKE